VSDWQMGPPLGEGNGQNDRGGKKCGLQVARRDDIYREICSSN
jgi:hypothetical protein